MTALNYYEISRRLKSEGIPKGASSWLYGLRSEHPFDNMEDCLDDMRVMNHPKNKHIWRIKMDALDAIGWDTTKFRVG
jgi:hypothetical protein